jgi:hypothetical protein
MADDQCPPEHTGNEAFAFTVGVKEFQTHDPIVDARKILTDAGFLPADDHVLIQLLQHGTRAVGLDEEVDLRHPGTEHFEAFASDRVFDFTIDERGYVWGVLLISEPRLRSLATVSEDKVLVLERHDEPPRVLKPEDQLDLATRGVEHLLTLSRFVTVIYNHDHKFELERGAYTGAELMLKFSVPAGYVLDLVKENGDFEELKDSTIVHVRDGMEFISHAPCGKSS